MPLAPPSLSLSISCRRRQRLVHVAAVLFLPALAGRAAGPRRLERPQPTYRPCLPHAQVVHHHILTH